MKQAILSQAAEDSIIDLQVYIGSVPLPACPDRVFAMLLCLSCKPQQLCPGTKNEWLGCASARRQQASPLLLSPLECLHCSRYHLSKKISNCDNQLHRTSFQMHYKLPLLHLTGPCNQAQLLVALLQCFKVPCQKAGPQHCTFTLQSGASADPWDAPLSVSSFSGSTNGACFSTCSLRAFAPLPAWYMATFWGIMDGQECGHVACFSHCCSASRSYPVISYQKHC